MDVAKLQILIQTKGVKAAQEELDKLTKSSGNAEKSVGGLAKSVSSLGTVFSAIAIASVAKEAIKMADTYKLVEGRLSLVTKNTNELSNAQNELFKISQNTRQSFKDTADLYVSLARATQQLGKSQGETLDVTNTINKAIIISGASAESAKAALVQLGQGFASGTLRGEELNSVLEQTPRVAEAIAKGMGVTIGQLRALGAEGSLTGKAVFEALQSQAQSIGDEFSKMPMTVSQATIQMNNSMTDFVAYLDNASGATEWLAKKISNVATEISKLKIEMVDIKDVKNLTELNEKLVSLGNEWSELEAKKGLSIFSLDWIPEGAIKTKQKEVEGLISLLVQGKDAFYKLGESALLSDRFSRSTEMTKKQLEDRFDEEKKVQDKILAERKSTEEKSKADAQKLAEEWAVKKREITASMAIAEQDELAKPFIILDQKYQEDLIKFKGTQEAKALLTANFNAEYQRLALDATTKVEEERLKVIEKTRSQNEKTIQKELKLQEENFRIQERQVALLDDQADREVATATLQYQRTQASLSAQLKMGEVSETYYDAMMNAEEKLMEKQKQNWTVYGQIINNTTAGMENSFMGFFDATNDGYMKLGELGKSIMRELYQEALRVALIKPLVGALTSAAMSGISGMFSTTSATTLPNASTSTAFTGSEPLQFAHGGTPTGLSSYSNQIVSKPTYFAFANGGVPSGGVMGEAGHEAIVPLTKMASGNYGVEASGMSGGSNVTINIENQTGMNLDLKQLTKSQDDKGNEIRTYVMKFASSDPEFRTALGLSR